MKYITKIVYSTQAHSKAHIVLQHKCTLQYSRRATNGERDRQGGMNAGGVKKDGRWRANSAAGRRRLLSCTNAQTSWSCTNYYDSFWVAEWPNSSYWRHSFWEAVKSTSIFFVCCPSSNILLTRMRQPVKGVRHIVVQFNAHWTWPLIGPEVKDSEWGNTCCAFKMLSSWFYGREDQFDNEDASSPQVTRLNEHVDRVSLSLPSWKVKWGQSNQQG